MYKRKAMANKKELVDRWTRGPGLTILRSRLEFIKSRNSVDLAADRREMLRILEGLPYREEVASGGDLRGAMFGGVSDLDLSHWDFSNGTMISNMFRCDLRLARF